MKTSDLSINIAAFIGASTDTIRRTVRKAEIPATRVWTALRFHLQKVSTYMRRNAEARFGARSTRALAGGAGRALADQPPAGKTGAQFPEERL